MRVLFVLALAIAAVAAVPRNIQRIVGGEATTIEQYPSMANLMYSFWSTGHEQFCGGTVINNRSILSAAHCFVSVNSVDPVSAWRVRLGSTFISSGGTIYDVALILIHPNYTRFELSNDVGILRLSSTIVYGNTVQVAPIAGPVYEVPDDATVWATGWGTTRDNNVSREELRHVQVFAINQTTCTSRYASAGFTITDDMLCSGVLDVGGRDQCQGDSGGPLYHNGVVVGICSWGLDCAHPDFPGVNARVSSFSEWITSNA